MAESYQQQQRQVLSRLLAGGGGVSTVPMQPDFTADPRRCLASVYMLPAPLAQRIEAQVAGKLKAADPRHYFYPPRSMHVTIKNIRTVEDPPLFSAADVEKCRELFRAVTARHGPVRFSFEETAAFSTSASVIGFCGEELKELILDLDSALIAAGVPDNKQLISDTVFFGNITVCRFTCPPSPDFYRALAGLHVREQLQVDVLTLLACDAVASPASCTIIERFPLGRR